MNWLLRNTVLALALLLVTGCGGEVRDDYNDSSFELVDQNGEAVHFPGDFHGDLLMMGFVYTNCPDICGFITANLKKVYQEAQSGSDVTYVLVTFDPERDTPEVLREYAEAFGMDASPFRFLTGEPEVIEEMMERVGVRTQISYTSEGDDGRVNYLLNHSDKILLINRSGQLVMEYGGSMTPVDILLEDLQKLMP
ncbi:MAG: SCO family protein [Balneolaceae bacterium]